MSKTAKSGRQISERRVSLNLKQILIIKLNYKQNAKAFFFCEANEELRRTLGSLRQPKCERFWTVVFGNLEEIEAFKYKS